MSSTSEYKQRSAWAIAWPYAALLACLVAVSVGSIEVLSGVRAYVGGEGLYSKAQKEALAFLSRYIETQSEEDFQAYQRAIAVPLGDCQARLAMSKPLPDAQAAREGFIKGQNDPADVGHLIFLFRWGLWFGPMRHAVDLWTQGDAYVLQIDTIAREVHASILDRAAAARDLREALERLRRIDAEVTPLEDEFSATLGQGARQLQIVLVVTVVITAGGLAVLAGFVFRGHRRERLAYESTLRVSEDRYRSVFENSIDPVLITSPDGAILEVNPAACRLFGYSSAEFIAAGRAAVLDESSESVKAAIKTRAETGHFEGSLEFRKKDGSRFIGELSAAIFTDMRGEQRSSIVVRDVTERNRLLEGIIRSEQRMELALEGADLGLWDFDIPSGNFTVNTRLLEMLGHIPGEFEINATAFTSRMHPADEQKFAAAFYAHLKGETPRYEAEYRLRHKDGHWVWIVSRGKVVQRSDDGRAVRILGTNRDITKRKLAEENEKRLGRAFKLLSRCDSALVHADEELELLGQICKLTVEVGGHLLAWVGYAESDAAKAVRPVAQAGQEQGYLGSVCLSWSDTDADEDPIGTAIRIGDTVVVQDIGAGFKAGLWRDAARQRGYHSCIALPLIVKKKVTGAFAIYSAEPFAFGKDEVELLEQLANDLAYGIQTLRSRLEHEQAQIILRRESEKNRALLRSASDGIHILDAAGNLLEASDSFCDMLGYTREEMLGMHVSQWDCKMSGGEIIEKLQGQALRRDCAQFETRHRRRDGTTFDVEVTGIRIELDGGLVIFNSSRDISERKRAEASLRESEMRLRAVIEQSPIGVSFARDGVTVEVNAVYLQMFGYSNSAEVNGRPVLEQIAPQCREEVADRIRRRSAGDPVDEGYETIGVRKDGSQFPLYVTAKRLAFKDGPVTIAFLIDVSRQRTSEEEIRRLAFYDHLTELPNRRLLRDRLLRALASSGRSGQHGSLLFIDLDDFKSLNDTLGHTTGDALLQQVAIRLKSCVRESDSIARMGGDEFVVILEDLSEQALEAAQQTEAVSKKILAALTPPYRLFSHEYHCTASIGATLFNGHEAAEVDLVKQADIAMYQAKKAGRNSIRFFDPKMQEAINLQAALQGELRQALGKRQFQLHFQVQVDKLNRPFGAEALIRWMHPTRGPISPAQFIPLAESTDLILPIGQWVLETACAQLKGWEKDEATRDLSLCVNVSAKQFHRMDFVEAVQTAVRQHAINPELLILELTESSLLKDIEETIATMKALRDFGIRFSLDDFGTGYSSLQYLKRLPLYQLKIDRSFVRDIAVDTNDLTIVQTIIAMARTLNLQVIAEGVETQEQRELLLSKGCDEFQGYLFGKPLAIDQFDAALKQAGAIALA